MSVIFILDFTLLVFLFFILRSAKILTKKSNQMKSKILLLNDWQLDIKLLDWIVLDYDFLFQTADFLLFLR